MSLIEATSWPKPILDTASSSKLSSHYFGLYNKILYKFFHPDIIGVEAEKSDLQSIYFIMYAKNHPVLLANVVNDVSLHGRYKADQQIRQKYDTLLTKCPLPQLWGLSFVGTTIRVYCGDVATGKVTPPSEDDLEEAWNIDLLSPEGFSTMKQIVKLVQESVAISILNN